MSGNKTLISQHLEGAIAFLKTDPLLPSIPAINHHIQMAVKLTGNVEKELKETRTLKRKLSAKEQECALLKGLLKVHKPASMPSAATASASSAATLMPSTSQATSSAAAATPLKPSTSQPTPSAAAARPLTIVSSLYVHVLRFSIYMACLGGAAVRRRSRDRKVASSTPGRGAIDSIQLSLPSLRST